jgi:hypothetical protein
LDIVIWNLFVFWYLALFIDVKRIVVMVVATPHVKHRYRSRNVIAKEETMSESKAPITKEHTHPVLSSLPPQKTKKG